MNCAYFIVIELNKITEIENNSVNIYSFIDFIFCDEVYYECN